VLFITSNRSLEVNRAVQNSDVKQLACKAAVSPSRLNWIVDCMIGLTRRLKVASLQGVEMIPVYSPPVRGRMEWSNRDPFFENESGQSPCVAWARKRRAGSFVALSKRSREFTKNLSI
jgi:hypothetical protein